jgi:hypothetical protein
MLNIFNGQNKNKNNQQESSGNDCIKIKDIINNNIQSLAKKVISSSIPSNITQDLKNKVNKLIEIFKLLRNIACLLFCLSAFLPSIHKGSIHKSRKAEFIKAEFIKAEIIKAEFIKAVFIKAERQN